jgi:hypothetical protein
MSNEHHSHSLDEIVASQVNSIVSRHVNSKEATARIKHEIFSELSESIKVLVANHRRVSPDNFLIRPRQLNNGSCLVLLDMDLPNTSNTYKLVVNESRTDQYGYSLTVFQENTGRLSASTFVDLKAGPDYEQYHEVQRQLKILRTANSSFKAPTVFTLMYVEKPIEGYEYYVEVGFDPLNEVADILENAAVAQEEVRRTGRTISAEPQNVITKRGPTPVPTPGNLSVMQDGHVTTVRRDA